MLADKFLGMKRGIGTVSAPWENGKPSIIIVMSAPRFRRQMTWSRSTDFISNRAFFSRHSLLQIINLLFTIPSDLRLCYQWIEQKNIYRLHSKSK